MAALSAGQSFRASTSRNGESALPGSPPPAGSGVPAGGRAISASNVTSSVIAPPSASFAGAAMNTRPATRAGVLAVSRTSIGCIWVLPTYCFPNASRLALKLTPPFSRR